MIGFVSVWKDFGQSDLNDLREIDLKAEPMVETWACSFRCDMD